MTVRYPHTPKTLDYLLELSEIASGTVKFTIALENNKAILHKLKHAAAAAKSL